MHLTTKSDGSANDRFMTLVELRPGVIGPMVFFAAGGSDDVRQYAPLARHMQTEYPIYGMQPRGLDGSQVPLESIEEMAGVYLDAMMKLQPVGPYILVGHSLGGLIALEIAQCLLRRSEKVALLAMLETYPHKSFLRPWEATKLFVRITKHHLLKARSMSVRDAVPYLVLQARRVWRPSDTDSKKFASRFASMPPLDPTSQRMNSSHLLAWRRYRPVPYAGRVRYIRAEQSIPHYPTNPRAVWSHLIKRLEVETVPGDHHSIILNPGDVASVLSRYLRELEIDNGAYKSGDPRKRMGLSST